MKLTIVAAALTIVAASICHGQNPQAPLRIGASLSLTGSYSEPGQAQERAYRVCVKQANERGRARNFKPPFSRFATVSPGREAVSRAVFGENSPLAMNI